jgi:hypothetical protein
MKFKTILWILTLLVAVIGVAAFVVSRKKIMFSSEDDLLDIDDYDDDDFEDYLDFESDLDDEIKSELSDEEVEDLGKDLFSVADDESSNKK